MVPKNDGKRAKRIKETQKENGKGIRGEYFFLFFYVIFNVYNLIDPLRASKIYK